MKPYIAPLRLLGMLFLAIGLAQVVVGLTLLPDKLGWGATLLYWTACCLATFAAVLCALLDALRSLGQSRRERRNLLEQTLREIDEQRASRNQRKGTRLGGDSPES
jgi:hypothetical protein